jgi:hypothetical protein
MHGSGVHYGYSFSVINSRWPLSNQHLGIGQSRYEINIAEQCRRSRTGGHGGGRASITLGSRATGSSAALTLLASAWMRGRKASASASVGTAATASSANRVIGAISSHVRTHRSQASTTTTGMRSTSPRHRKPLRALPTTSMSPGPHHCCVPVSRPTTHSETAMRNPVTSWRYRAWRSRPPRDSVRPRRGLRDSRSFAGYRKARPRLRTWRGPLHR